MFLQVALSLTSLMIIIAGTIKDNFIVVSLGIVCLILVNILGELIEIRKGLNKCSKQL